MEFWKLTKLVMFQLGLMGQGPVQKGPEALKGIPGIVNRISKGLETSKSIFKKRMCSPM
jgi:hypothetical protein